MKKLCDTISVSLLSFQWEYPLNQPKTEKNKAKTAAFINCASFYVSIQYLGSKTSKKQKAAEERESKTEGYRGREAKTGLAPVTRKCGVML